MISGEFQSTKVNLGAFDWIQGNSSEVLLNPETSSEFKVIFNKFQRITDNFREFM